MQGKGPAVVLIPSGEGDCGSFARVSSALADEFTVLTFDMPGFSRSSAPPTFQDVTAGELADQVSALVELMGLAPASFYGCSSGGQAALSLVADHPNIVRNAIVHEVPLATADFFTSLKATDDAKIVAICKGLFRNELNENPKAWDDLGEDFHRRLEKNYVTWVRRYGPLRTYSVEELNRRPIAWTIGGFTPTFAMFDNVRAAHAANIEIGLLMCKHFPQVSIPDALAAAHSRKCDEASAEMMQRVALDARLAPGMTGICLGERIAPNTGVSPPRLSRGSRGQARRTLQPKDTIKDAPFTDERARRQASVNHTAPPYPHSEKRAYNVCISRR